MLIVDGSQGEGGGQVLRSSLALSMVTGTPFRIVNIRAGRKKPGLMRQHLTSVRAARDVCSAEVQGDVIGSTEVTFSPGKVQAGDYRFSIGTAGSTTLVFQTVLPALMLADGPSTLTLEGGTHNPFAPPFDFLTKAFLPMLEKMGPVVRATLERPGFFPAGGGQFTAQIEPAATLNTVELVSRGEVTRRAATATVANLPREIAEREVKVARRKLGWPEDCLHVREVRDTPGPGNIVTLEVETPELCEVFTGFGERGRAAEAVATQAVQQCQRYLKCGVPVGEYLADQILLPMAIAGQGAFHTIGLSRHTSTHIELVKAFLGCQIKTEDMGRDGTVVQIT